MNLVHFSTLYRAKIAKPRLLLRHRGSFEVPNSRPNFIVTNLGGKVSNLSPVKSRRQGQYFMGISR